MLAREDQDLSSQKLHEDSDRLRRLYETVLASTPDLVYVFGLDHRFEYANASLLGMWGRTWEDAIGKTCLELGYEPWHAKMHDDEIDQVVATKLPIRGVVSFNGEYGLRMYDYIFTPILSPEGEVEAVAGTTRDVTDRIAAEQALRESETRYRSLFESMEEGFCTLELENDEGGHPVDCRLLQINPAFERISGLTDAKGKSIRELAPGAATTWIKTFDQVASTGESRRIVELDRASGRWFDVNAFCIDEPTGRKVAALFSEVTERKQREANLSFLAEVDRDLAGLASATEIMEVLGAKVGDYLSLAACNFCRVTEVSDELTTDFGWNNDDVPNLVRTYRLSEFFAPSFVQAGRKGEIVVIRDTQADDRVDGSAYAELRIGSFVMVPFHRNGQWTDLFGAIDSKAREWREDELELLLEIANRIFPRLERARAEQSLRESEGRFRAAVGAIGVLWTNSPDGRMVGEQPGWHSLTGQTQQEYEGFGWSLAVHPEDVQPTIDAWNQAVREKRPFFFEHRVRTCEGVWRHFSIRAVPVLDVEGRIREWVGVHVDITETREYEHALRDSEAQYRQIAEGLPQLVWSAGPDGTRDYFNGRWLEFTGIGMEQSKNPWTAVMHPEDLSQARSVWDLSIETGNTFQAEYRLRSRAGHYRWFLGRAIAIRNEKDEVVRWFGTCTDIDDQKAIQNTLEVTNDFAVTLAADLDLERIVQSLTDASTSAIGAEFGAFSYNVANEEGDGFQLLTFSGATPWEFEMVELPTATPLFGTEGTVRSDDLTKDLRYELAKPFGGMPERQGPVVSYLAVPVVSRSGEVIGGLFFGHSRPAMFSIAHERIVTSFATQAALAMDNARLYERVRVMNEELEGRVESRTGELLAAVERLQGFTYHVSHDLRAPLRAIASTSRIIQEDFGSAVPPEVLQLLDRQAEAATKLGKLVDDLLRHSRLARQEMVRHSIDVTSLARDVFDESRATHPYSLARIEVMEGMKAEADPGLLRLALYNLVENAVKYSPMGGTIRVGQRPDGAFFVSDEGIGMESQYLHKIFEPFQRLHRDDEFKGTGIGLANVRQVVERHGGSVWAESKLGEGSVVFLTLP